MENLRYIRKQKGLSMKALGDIIGVAESTISLYETGKRQPDNDTLIKLANTLNVSTDYLLGLDSNLSSLRESQSFGTKINVVGKVPAGVPTEAIEYIVDEVEISEKLASDSHTYFALMVTGDSMYPEYMDGDIVIVRKTPVAETGDDVVAYVNGFDATLKRLIFSSKGLTLRALNPAYESKTYTNQEIEELPITIAGVVVEQRRNR